MVIVLTAGEIRRVLYLSFIVVHFNYCCETWHFCSKGATEKLEKINERAITFVDKHHISDKHTKYEELLRQLQSQAKIVETLPLNAVFFCFWPVSSSSQCCLSQLTHQILNANIGRVGRQQVSQ